MLDRIKRVVKQKRNAAKNDSAHVPRKEAEANSAISKPVNWMDEIISEYEQKRVPNEYFGKPIQLEDTHNSDYLLNKILKNNHVLLPWIEQQHKVRDAIRQLIDEQERMTVEQIGARLDEINKEVAKYNRMCPSYHLQKSPLFLDAFSVQYKNWT